MRKCETEGGGGRGIYLSGERISMCLIITRCRVSSRFFFARLRILAGANVKTTIFSDNYEDGSGYKWFLFDRSDLYPQNVIIGWTTGLHARLDHL